MASTIRFQRGSESLDLMANGLLVVADTWDVSEVGHVRFTLAVTGADADDAADKAQAVNRWLDDARLGVVTGDWVELAVARGTSSPVYYDVTGGTVTPAGGRDQYNAGALLLLSIDLTTLEYPRGEPYTIPVSGTLTNGAIQVVVEDVPGDVPALVQVDLTDVSTSGVINRVTIVADGAADAISAGDLDPWVDVTHISPATSTGDATAFGGSYATRAISNTTAYADIARAVMPAGALNKGPRNVWARVYDPAAAIGAPSSLVATDAGFNPRIVQSASAGATGSGTTVAPSFGAATLEGSTLFCVVEHPVSGISHSMAAPWSKIDDYNNASPALHSTLWIIENAASTSGAQTVTFGSSTTNKYATVFEVAGVRDYPLELMTRTYVTSSPVEVDSGADYDPSDVHPTYALALYTNNSAPGGSGGQWSAPTFGFTERSDAWAIAVYDRVVTSGRPVASVPAIRTRATSSSGTAFIAWLLALGCPTTAPGDLAPGTYTIRVAAVDASGGVSNATSSATPTVAYNLGAIALTWNAPASGTVTYYRITITAPNGKTYLITTPTNATSYTITSLADAREVPALDATSGAVPTPNRIRAKAGLAGGTMYPVGAAVPVPLSSAWVDALVAADVELPPVVALMDGTRPDWQIDIDAISGSGVSSAMRVDALWVVPACGASCVLEIPGMAHGTKRRWLAETTRSGKAMTGWLRSTADGSIINSLLAMGALTFRPGDNTVAIRVELAGGVSNVDTAQATVAFTVTPRYRWTRGTG